MHKNKMNKRKICIMALIMIAIIAVLSVRVFADDVDSYYADWEFRDEPNNFGLNARDSVQIENVFYDYSKVYEGTGISCHFTVKDGSKPFTHVGVIIRGMDDDNKGDAIMDCFPYLYKYDYNDGTIRYSLSIDLHDENNRLKPGKYYIGEFVFDDDETYNGVVRINGEELAVAYAGPTSQGTSIVNGYDADNEFEVIEAPKLEEFSIDGNNIFTKNESVKFNFSVSSGEPSMISLMLADALEDTGKVKLQTVVKNDDKEFELLYKNKYSDLMDGKYYVKYIYVMYPEGQVKYTLDDFDRVELEVHTQEKTNEEIKDNLQSISLDKTSAKLNENVFVDMITTNAVKEATLIFNKDDGSENMIVTLTDTNEKPYFKVPFTASAGAYSLNYLILKDINGEETQYRSGEDYLSIKHFDFNCSLTVEEEFANTDILHLENEKITDAIIQKIAELDDNVVIEITADQNTTIDSKIFEAIKGTNKTLRIKYNTVEWYFSGRDITNAKSIDVRVWVYGIYNDEMYGWAIKSGLGLSFADNGVLPGKCLIRVKNTGPVEQYLNGKISYVYFYEPGGYDFDKVAMQVNCVNGEYYEFYISHNSTYIMTTEQIDNQYVTNNTADLSLNDSSVKATTTSDSSVTPVTSTTTTGANGVELDTITIMKYGLAILCVVLLILIATGRILSNKNKNNNNKTE